MAEPDATEIEARVRAIATELAPLEGPLLPILHAVQAAFGHVPAAALPVIADVLNLSRAEVYGVMSFYHDFRAEPAGRKVLKICRAEACQAMGADAVAARALAALGVDWHGTTADGAVTLEPVYCLGLCACAPAAMINGRVVGRVDDARLDALIDEALA
ncbi:MAG: formate dehydrogenase subunit gamma [Confluentimicrobium sp.]|mgnify:CR=1 FL=1|jgi:formate dehydrogenase subunit gamma|uniref:formate dehydrogenase subunit gamma n=1 Tax=Actibacterium sp. TaxID=1872125 RepID=UPI000C35F733|nr:formate dehydrogenase subunit gamma [Actibacterium sp.]MBC57302.1 formate dehydrogenase subunit gamma [Actibacterium sp.]MDY6861187.1 formate dehydrogenase subunit gamma [Pseudomonadota bacterium]|tara:strand:- start:375 stop:851 length:477 start_codon:yes stop_codon:yes gene_type:complete